MNRNYRLQGRVLDHDGAPAASAEVRLEPGGHRATTGVDGKFVVDGLTTSRLSLTAHKDDHCAGPLTVSRDDSHAPVILQLAPGGTLIVHVRADRAPVVGAVLTIDGVPSATSDATGTVTIAGLTPRGHHGWLVARGYAYELISMRADRDPTAIVERSIALQPSSRIEGVLRDRSGEPIGDASVTLSGTDLHSPRYHVSTDTDGSWRADARAGTYKVSAWSDSHGSSTESTVACDGQTPVRGVALRCTASRVQIAAIRLAGAIRPWLARRARITGIVVDARGQPVAGAFVTVAEPAVRGVTMISWNGATDARGRFEAAVLGRLAYDVFAKGPQDRDLAHREDRQRARIGSHVRIVLPSRATITGRVLLDGIPLRSFGVALTAPRSHAGSPIAVRDRDGRFEIARVAPGTWQVVVLGPGTLRKVIGDIALVRDQHVDLGDIAMERGQRIAGHVRDRGAPVAGARVIVGRWAQLLISGERSQLEQSFHGRFERRTDDAGAYAFEGIDSDQGPFGAANIWAEHHDGRASVIQPLPAGDATIDFSLLGTGRIVARIDGLRGGRPVAQAIRADEPRAARMASMDETGHFVFDDLPSGSYRVCAGEIEDISSAEITLLEAQTANVTLMMKTPSVKLTVIVPRGRGADLVIESVSEGAGVRSRGRSISVRGAEEHCHLSFVRPGDYRLSLDKIAWTPITISAAPATRTVDLRRAR